VAYSLGAARGTTETCAPMATPPRTSHRSGQRSPPVRWSVVIGVYRYPTDRVPLHTSLKSRQVVGHASTHCHMSYGSGPRLPAEVRSGIATCPMASDLTSQLRWDLVLPRALRFQTLPPSYGGLRCCHVSYGSRPHLSAEVGSGVATCSMALDLTSQLRWALTQLHTLWLWTSPPGRGGLRCYHVSRGSLWVVSFKHKEKPSRSACAARHACAHISMVPHIRAIMRLQYVLADCVVNTCKACGHASKVRL
jgi:hypothetical protein